MRTRTRTSSKNPQVIRIPKPIQKDIEEKGFHLYKWISPDEVKLSIERDFLKTLKYIGTPLGVIAVLAGLIFTFIGFFFVIFIGIFFMFFYLLFLSIRRSRLLTKSAFVVLTDSSISLGGKIHKLSNISGLKKDIGEVSETFEEHLFEDSTLHKSKQKLEKTVMERVFGGYKSIFDNVDGRGILLVLLFYTLYVAIMAVVYFIGVLFLMLFGKIIVWLNTRYLIKRGMVVLKINQLFGDLDVASQDIKSEKKSLEKLLTRAQENDWKDGLLLEINSGIEEINTKAQEATLSVLELRNTITSSKYKDMFSFGVYNGWIKKQIAKPLEQILELLMLNKEMLEAQKQEIESQMKKTDKADYKANLKLQIKRLKIQLAEISRFVPMLESSISKLS